MSIETFSPLPLTTFGTWITLLDPSDVPPGMSPNLADVEFFPGGVRTRPGLVSQYPTLPSTPQINSLKTFITPNSVERLLLLDSLGNFYKETAPGVLSLMFGGATGQNRFFKSTTHFGREYMAFSDAVTGQDIPRQYDDFFFDRVSQIGPAESPSVADSSTTGSITPGVHQCAVIFVTRQGFWTAPSPPVSWTSTGNKVNATNIPTRPSHVVQRLLAFTAQAGANFYNVPATMTINDNTTTSLTVDFTDAILLSGTSTAVPNGSLVVSGLAAATTCYFYPYWDEAAAAIAWVAGGVGSPTNAQAAKTNSAAQQQALQGRVPLSQGAMVAATTSSGTGGGSGGGSGSCLRSGTVVLTKERGTVEIETCKVGEHLRCPSATGLAGSGRAGTDSSEGWTRIVRLEIRDADTFIRLHFSNAETLDVTPHHIFTLADGSPMRAERLCLCDVLIGRFGRLTLKRIEAIVVDPREPASGTSDGSARQDAPGQKVTVSCEPTHQFFAGRHAASVLTHNYTFSS